ATTMPSPISPRRSGNFDDRRRNLHRGPRARNPRFRGPRARRGAHTDKRDFSTAQRRPPTSHQRTEESSMLFQPATNTMAHLKAGFMGKPGSGKTLTAS